MRDSSVDLGVAGWDPYYGFGVVNAFRALQKVDQLMGFVKAKDWFMFRHDLHHTGTSPSIAPNTNRTLWSYTVGTHVFSSPAVVGGKVYVGSWDGKFYCFSLPVTNASLIVRGQDNRIYYRSYNSSTSCGAAGMPFLPGQLSTVQPLQYVAMSFTSLSEAWMATRSGTAT